MPSTWVIAVLGATGTGKTALAVRLAEALDGEVVNADAFQVYRGLDIGTAKPSAEERRGVPHHLLDILEPEEPFSAGVFARRAGAAIEDIAARARVPIVAGGSGLYLRALLDGLAPIPPVVPGVRARLRARLEEEGLASLRAELERRDPLTAARLAAGDTQRISRALEVALATGRPLSEWLGRKSDVGGAFEAFRVGLTLPRAILYDRLAVRVRRMFARGWVAEVAALLDRGVDPDAPAFRAIGYRQIVAHLSGTYGSSTHGSSTPDLEAAIEEIIRATRRYAKRQVTWFRKEPDVEWLPASDLEAHIPSLLRTLRARRRKLVE